MLKELRTIIDIEGTTSTNGLEARRQALEHWIGKYVTELIVENSVLKSRLNASEIEFMKNYQAFQLAEKILEDHAMVSTEGNKVKVKVLVLNKDYPKNKDR